MDTLVVENLCREWAPRLEGLCFRGLRQEPALARIYLGPARGERGAVWALEARWAEPLWLKLEESNLPKERDRVEASLRLDGAPILRLLQPGFDRRLRFELGTADRPAGFLDVEAWPPGNLVLVDAKATILWVARRRPISTLRSALAVGLGYPEPPPPFRRDPRRASAAEISELLARAGHEESTAAELEERLAHHWAGVPGPLGRDAARQVAAVLNTGESSAERAANALSQWAKAVYSASGPVVGYRWQDKHSSATLVCAASAISTGTDVDVLGPWPDWSSAATGVAASLPDAISSEEISEARRRVSRSERSLEMAKKDLERARSGPELRRQGEALLVSLHLVKRGRNRVTVPDPADPSHTLDIGLRPNLAPHENANRLFKDARRMERALNTIPSRQRVLEAERDKAMRLLDALESGVRPADAPPPPVRGTLSPGRPARTQLGPAARKGEELPAKLEPRRYRSREGWEILVGKSNQGNDYLTHRIARGEDYWFHVQGSAGSHVVLRRGKGKDEPSRDTLREVASWTAFFSRQKSSGTVPVIHTRKKYVRKPRGAKPGLAEVRQEKSIFVRPVEPPAEAAISRDDTVDSPG